MYVCIFKGLHMISQSVLAFDQNGNKSERLYDFNSSSERVIHCFHYYSARLIKRLFTMIQFKMLKIVFRQKAPLWDGGFSGSKKTEAVFKHKTTGVGPTPENHLTLTSH